MSWFYKYVNYGSERTFAEDDNEQSPLLGVEGEDENEVGDEENKNKPIDDVTTM